MVMANSWLKKYLNACANGLIDLTAMVTAQSRLKSSNFRCIDSETVEAQAAEKSSVLFYEFHPLIAPRFCERLVSPMREEGVNTLLWQNFSCRPFWSSAVAGRAKGPQSGPAMPAALPVF